MNIYIKMLVVFAILMIQFTCSSVSEAEEIKPDSNDYLVDSNSTDFDNVIPVEYQTPNKRSLKSEPNQEEATNAIETLEFENSFTQEPNTTYSKLNSSENENEINHEESDSITSEEIVKSSNVLKHQSRSLKDFKFKDNEFYETFSRGSENEDGFNMHKYFLNFLLGTKFFEKFNTKEKFQDSLKKLNNKDRFILEQIFETLHQDPEGEIPVPVIPMGEDAFRVLIELGINPFNLNKRVNPLIYNNITKIYKELIDLIEVDIKSNNFPLVFYQTVSPIIKENLLPLLNEPNLKQEINIIDKDRKFPGLFIILRNIIKIPEDLKNEYTISNFFRIIDKDLSKRKMSENEGNKFLGKLYKNGVKSIQRLLAEDWKENKAPMNFLQFISDYFKSEKFLVVGRLLNQMLTQKLEMNEGLNKNDAEFFWKFSRKEEL